MWAATAGVADRARAAHRRVPARALLLGLGLPREPADRRRSASSPASSSSRTRRIRRRRALDPVGAVAVDRRAEPAALRGHRGADARAGRPRARSCRVRSRRGGLAAFFFWWELHTDHPMLDLRFFKNPRFSAASRRDHAVFFAMFGSIFVLTQYFQFVLGYSRARRPACGCSPWAIPMMIVAPLSAQGRRTHRHEAHGRRSACRSSRSACCCSRGVGRAHRRTSPAIMLRHGPHGDRHGAHDGAGHRRRSWARCRWPRPASARR